MLGMKQNKGLLAIFALGGALICACGQFGGGNPLGVGGGNGIPTQPDPDPDVGQPLPDGDTEPNGNGLPNGNNPPGDAADGGNGSTNGPFTFETLTAQIRNESDFRADVTVRFLADNVVVHLAFTRVMPHNITSVRSSKQADQIEFSGLSEQGSTLTTMTLVLGRDFDTENPAVYVIANVPADDPEDSPPADPVEITMLEPATDIQVTLGTSIFVRWDDAGGSADAVVRLFLQPEADTHDDGRIPLGPVVAAASDGLNDQFSIVVEGIEPGRYVVIGEISDDSTVASSTAGGILTLVVDEDNQAPTLTILSPTTLVELKSDETLFISWDDEDPDDNAAIVFRLEAVGPDSVGIGPFLLTPPIAEDPDGLADDSVAASLAGVLPGLYDLVGEIDDGRLTGTDRVTAVVRVLEAPTNDPPHLELLEPSTHIDITPGGTFLVRWVDEDANDDAQISLYLDPDLQSGSLDGNEILLASAISEDGDGGADEIILGIPSGIPKATYRVTGAITDGVTEIITWAPGRITLRAADDGLPPEPSIRLVKPTVEVRTRLGLDIPILVETEDIPQEAVIRFVLSNVAFGGSTRVTFSPGPIGLDQDETLRLAQGSVPNDAWPRQFELAVLLVLPERTLSSTAPASVWIRQEVEVIDVQRISFDCTRGAEPTFDDRFFVGLEIIWFGGGYSEREPHADLVFWLTEDGTIPDDSEPDPTHRAFLMTMESPNVIRLERVGLQAIFGPASGGDIVIRALLPGSYWLSTVATPASFGRVVGPTYRELIEVCFQESD